LSVYLQPEALRPTYSSSSSSSSIQDFTSTHSIAQQPLESKISSILYALERGHGTIATTIADIGMATHPTEAKHFLELSAVAKAQLLNDSEGAIKDASNALRLHKLRKLHMHSVLRHYSMKNSIKVQICQD